MRMYNVWNYEEFEVKNFAERIGKINDIYGEYFIKDVYDTPKVSIIIPVYNVENYIEECLASVLKQTFKNYEVIIVNDGTTDNSAQIASVFTENDSRFKLVNQENQGLSGARNTGIQEAKGEYIAFLDSDDWIDKNFIEKLLEAIIRNDCDIAAASIIRKREKTQKYRVHYTQEKIHTTYEEKISACRIPACCYVWNKLYKTTLVKQQSFKYNVYYEDVLWTPQVLKKSEKLVTVPNVNYYYRVNKSSIVKKIQSPKKQRDSYFSKKFMINFLEENGIVLSKKEKTFTKKIKYFFNLPILKIKEYENQELTYLMGFLPINKKTIPHVKNNTFFVWEPCSQSHSEVVPGYVKYLLDLNYHVSVLVEPDRFKEGLFAKFNHRNMSLNFMTRAQIKNYFMNEDLSNVAGVMVTTAGKLCDCIDYTQCYSHFNKTLDKSKLLLVEHEASFAGDKGTWDEKLITLRKLDYKNLKSVVVNPHYFGDVKITPKNSEITNFITIGAIKPNKKNSDLIINAVKELHEKGITNFKVTVVGKGHLKNLPLEIQKYFDIKGRLPFSKMYEEIEKADFILTAYDDKDKEHIRYNTSGTSGNFQLVYGFLKPCLIIESFMDMNEFTPLNSIGYKTVNAYSDAMEKGIRMQAEEYKNMQENLAETVRSIYDSSLCNLRGLIDG